MHRSPHGATDAKHVARLVGQMIRVSLETVAIVNGLPDDFSG